MAKELTAAAVLRLRPSAQTREVRDGGCPGLYLQIQRSGHKSWALRFRRPDGRTAKLTLGPADLTGREASTEPKRGAPLTLASARALAIDLHRQRAMGRDIALAVDRGTFAESAKDFVDQHSKRRVRRWQDQARLLGVAGDGGLIPEGLAARWRNKLVDDIDGDMIHAIVDEVRVRGVPGLASRMNGPSEPRAKAFFAALSKMFGWLVEKRRVRQNPCAGVHPPETAKARERVLSDSEIVAFWRSSDGERLGPILKLLLLTGARRNEVSGMRDGEVVENTWTIPGGRTKNHRTHVVPLPPLAVRILNGATEFGIPGSKVKARLDKAMAKHLGSPPPPWRIHDLRRTAATGMAEIGIAPHIVEACLNHISGAKAGVAGTYNRAAYASEKKAAFERWADHIQTLVGIKTI